MNTRLVLLAAALALPAAASAQTAGTLRPFHSDRELVRYLERLRERPPGPPTPAPAPQPACEMPLVTPAPAETWSGPPEQAPAVVWGRVTNPQGCPESAVLVRIESLNVGAATAADGTYRLVIPGQRIMAGQAVLITAARAGLSPGSRNVTLATGARLTQNFQLASAVVLLEDVAVSGVSSAPSITNNQHEGVDEGAIVKL
ncbi:MAG TPA: hypothetical protein VGX50_14525, partial [Longimicrobium sp.]|nr:hypothetical protein [Longimicrobium sp.]